MQPSSPIAAKAKFLTRNTYCLLGLLLIVAAFLRFFKLGELGLWGDEDHLYFATKGILEHGIPQMPSEMIYPRAALLSYLSALSASIFGLDETAIRAPSVLFSLVNIVIYSYLTFRLLGKPAAMIFAVLFTVSYWNIEIARHARMYELMLLVYGVIAITFLEAFMRSNLKLLFATIPLAALAISTHAIAVTLNIFYALPLLTRRWKFPIIPYGICIGVSGAIQLGVVVLIKRFYNEGYKNIRIDQSAPSPNLPLQLLEQLRPDSLSLTIASLLVVSTVGVAIWLWSTKRWFISAHPILINIPSNKVDEALLYLTLAVTGVTSLLGIYLWALLIYIYRAGVSINTLLSRPLLITAFGIGFFYVSQAQFDAFSSIKESVKSLLFYPYPIALRLLEVLPAFTALSLAGATLIYKTGSITKNAAHAMLLIAVLGPMFVIGLMQEHPWIRYLYLMYPFMLMLSIYFVLQATELLIRRFAALNKFNTRTLKILVGIFGLSLLTEGHSISEAVKISSRTYASHLDSFLFPYVTHPDHKTTAEYVANNASTDDIVVIMDFISAAYIADPDFMLRTRKSFNNADTTHDLFIGIPILNTFDAFKELLNTGTSNIWLIESQELIGHHRLQSGQSQAFNNFIKEERSSIVYTGLDGLTNVRLWQAKSFPK